MAKQSSLADVLAELGPPPGDHRPLGVRLEEAGLVDQVLEARKADYSFERIAKGLTKLGIKITANPVADFCRERGVD